MKTALLLLALGQSTPPEVGVFYYPWYSTSGWSSSGYLRGYLDARQPPALGEYTSASASVAAQHVAWCRGHGIDFLSVSWWGPAPDYRDTNIRTYLVPALEATGGVRFCIFYETRGRLASSGSSIPIDAAAEATLVSDFTYIVNTFAVSPRYLMVAAKPVIMIYLTRDFTGDYVNVFANVRAQVRANTGYDLYLIGDEVYWGAPDSSRIGILDAVAAYNMHGPSQYSGYDAASGFTAAVSAKYAQYRAAANGLGKAFVPDAVPGFNDRGVRLSADHYAIPRRTNAAAAEGSLFQAQLAMCAANLDPAINMLMITSFNEWFEDTQIEPNSGAGPSSTPTTYTQGYTYDVYGTAYLQAVADMKASFGAGVSGGSGGGSGGCGALGLEAVLLVGVLRLLRRRRSA